LVLSAGRLWDEGKNVASVTAAAARMPWPVYVAGDTDGADLQGVKSLGRLSSVSLAGWYSRAAIYALPARYEPFGLSALEAALSGCALVLGDIPSLREVWGPAAIFVHPDDVEGLARAVTSLAEDAARLREMAARAMTRATHYNMGRTADTYLSLYKELSGAPTAAPGGLHACVS
jgi:glycosyltransferase involved in cell wall biosynthesis